MSTQIHALTNIAGLILAGGRSLRFGEEKAVAAFRGGVVMDGAVHLLAALPAFAVSARPGSGAERRALELGAPVLHDAPDAPSGPLAGVAVGLAWARRAGFAFVATVPCDAPLLPIDLVARLAKGIGAAPAAFARTAYGEHPLCALWRVTLADRLSARLDVAGHPAVRAWLREIGAAPVPFEDAAAFANANTADVLATLELRA